MVKMTYMLIDLEVFTFLVKIHLPESFLYVYCSQFMNV